MKTKNSFHPLCPNIEIVARAAVRGPWWCCGLVVMQPAYTTTPYTIHYRGSLIKFNIRTRTSYHTTILCTAAVYPVPSSGCCVYSYAPYNVDDNTGTIPILIPSYTVIRCCGTPRNTETKYRYSTSRNTGKYRKNTITRFERTIFYKY